MRIGSRQYVYQFTTRNKHFHNTANFFFHWCMFALPSMVQIALYNGRSDMFVHETKINKYRYLSIFEGEQFEFCTGVDDMWKTLLLIYHLSSSRHKNEFTTVHAIKVLLLWFPICRCSIHYPIKPDVFLRHPEAYNCEYQ